MTEAKTDASNSVYIGSNPPSSSGSGSVSGNSSSAALFDTNLALRQLRLKYNQHVDDVYTDAVYGASPRVTHKGGNKAGGGGGGGGANLKNAALSGELT